MPTTTDHSERARYDGVAEWYDAQLESAPHRHEVLRANLSSGSRAASIPIVNVSDGRELLDFHRCGSLRPDAG